jgi:hypothetical protein
MEEFWEWVDDSICCYYNITLEHWYYILDNASDEEIDLLGDNILDGNGPSDESNKIIQKYKEFF